MKIKTAELTGPALDWAVAKCEGEILLFAKGQLNTLWSTNGFHPSTDWAHGGPIIEREEYDLHYDVSQAPNVWQADNALDQAGTGPTQLIAAMRCKVASHFGDEVEIPGELT